MLEEECENNSSSFTFISGCEKIQENLTNNNDEFHANEFSSVMESDELSVDVRGLNTHLGDDHDTLSHCQLPVIDLNWNNTCTNSGGKCYFS